MSRLMWALFLGCGSPEVPVDLAIIPVVRVAVATTVPETVNHVLYGTLAPIADSLLSATTGGTVVSIGRDVGDEVTRGDVIVQLDNTMTQATVSVARAALTEADLVRDDSERQRHRAEAVQGQASAVQTERAVLGHQRAQAAQKRANAQLAIAQFSHRQKSITAPYAGHVVQVFPEVGELVGPGAPVARVADTSSLRIEIGLSASEVALFDSVDAEYSVSVGKISVAASLMDVATVADPRTRTWPMTLAVPVTEGFIAGMAATVTVSFANQPADAMVPMTSFSGGRVWVVDGTSVRSQRVELVSESDANAFVRGVDVGAHVVVAPPTLHEGQTVTVLGGSVE